MNNSSGAPHFHAMIEFCGCNRISQILVKIPEKWRNVKNTLAAYIKISERERELHNSFFPPKALACLSRLYVNAVYRDLPRGVVGWGDSAPSRMFNGGDRYNPCRGWRTEGLVGWRLAELDE